MTATAEIAGKKTPQYEFGYFADFSRTSDIPALRTRINDVIRGLGLSDFVYIRLNSPDNPQLLLNTLPQELILSYCAKGCFEHDMTLQRAKDSSTPYFCSSIHDYLAEAPFTSAMTCCMNEILKLNQSFGFYDFFHIPIASCNQPAHALLSVTQRSAPPEELADIVRGQESTLGLISEAIERVVATQFSREIIGKLPEKTRQLTRNSKPLKVLSTLANNDYNISQVAKKLSISIVTVNQHLKTARNQLGTRTNYAAIKQAVLSNLIDYKQLPGNMKKMNDN